MKVKIEILNGTNASGGGCSCCPSAGSCGTNPYEEYEAVVEKVSEDLKEKFGEQVTIQYINADQEGLGNYPLVSKVLQMGYPYPITVIDGEPKFAGGIMVPELVSSIEGILKQQ
ncbi:hypothetical protein [Syntrophomonas palmitatica]|uniref:hypothetical protein n=1 Tax=Syntrophomonas palmitatica TaxID=402877 RepID=UPI0006D03722|nr:hypothetical protein [Syntrophomonas palmitatica]